MNAPPPASDIAAPAPVDDGVFKRELAGVIPHLRAYGRSLAGNPDVADDLVQDTMLKAWASRASFAPGSSIKAWTFVILRNVFFSQLRRQKFHGDYDEAAAERQLVVAPAQEDGLNIADLQRAMQQLSLEQREALILVGAGGMSYEDAASVAGCAVGTMKSRVSRARKALADLIDGGQLQLARRGTAPSTSAVATIMNSVATIVGDDGNDDAEQGAGVAA